MAALKILYTSAAVNYTDSERYIHSLMVQMRARQHQVEALCQPGALLAQHLEADDFVVHYATMNSGIDFWRNVLPLRRLLKQQAYNVINTQSHQDTVQIGLIAHLTKSPLIIRTCHAKPTDSLLSYKRLPHRVITTSQFIAKQLAGRGINPNHIDTIYPAINFKDPLPQQKLRMELGLDGSHLLVGSITDLHKGKGVQELIQAMAPILRAQPKVHVVIIGDGSLYTQLENFATQLEVRTQVHFLGNRNDVSELIGNLDIFALATQIEPSGMVFLEAAAAKLPVIGTQIGAVSEMMSAGKSGMLIPLHDVVALRKALQRLIENPDLRQQMGQAGYDYAVTAGSFSLNAQQQRTEHSYRRWLSQLGK